MSEKLLLTNDLNVACDYNQYALFKVSAFNSAQGYLPGPECPKCLNKGFVMFLINQNNYAYETLKKCECASIRSNMETISKSGLAAIMNDCTFDSFLTPSQWQADLKNIARQFLADTKGKWFYLGGQVGCGKTHLCAAIVGELMKNGTDAKYMMWRDEIVALKADITNSAYSDAIQKIKSVKVLYIDDFLKTQKDKPPSAAEMNVAFEIINYRYNVRDSITVLSSEKSLTEIGEFDEAVSSRISQRSKGYSLFIKNDSQNNYRLQLA